MKVGILTRNAQAWCTAQLREALGKVGAEPITLNFGHILARVGGRPAVESNRFDVAGLAAMIVRPIGSGSLDQVILRIDVLHRLERLGLPVINSPSSIERAVDKYHALCMLEERGHPVPRTAVAEGWKEALGSFYELGGDVVVKPLFGSRGVGSTRISDPDIATRVFKLLAQHRQAIYVQEYLPHGGRDIRAFVVGREVVASMYRVAEGWKTNVSQGARPVQTKLEGGLSELAVNAVGTLGCEIAGVDLMETPKGPVVLEVNSQPGWKGLQSVTERWIAGAIARYVVEKCKR
ncbi:MAG: RimK family alpha-L-glutamate ligase [Candidatus Brockarchaeota archaeon]|nr:RimK family alpha-L-glutamate ligase [Candidatus Brockarchaeota archaeon]